MDCHGLSGNEQEGVEQAHRFFPENRKDYIALWSGRDIHTVEGLQEFRNDCHRAFVYLAVRAHGTWHDDWDLPPIGN